MKFYILGYETHERGETLRMMTRREFNTYEEAAHYISTVHPSWKPFVVATATPPDASSEESPK